MLPRLDLYEKSPFVITPRFNWAGDSSPRKVEVNASIILSNVMSGLSGKIEQAVSGDKYWWNIYKKYHSIGKSVLRTTPLIKKDYLDFLEPEIESNELEVIKSHMPDSEMWLIEISVPELYPLNNRRLGEMILCKENDHFSPCLIRLPGVAMLVKNNTLELMPIQADYHYPIRSMGTDDMCKFIPNLS